MNKKMRARKRRQARRVALTLVLMLTVALVSIGGTIAWLTASTAPVVNTFTVGNIKLDLYEHVSADSETEIKANSLQIIPGNTLYKDPTVEVQATSEPCYIFVKVEKKNWTAAMDSQVTYAIDPAWTEVPGQTNVYYQKIDAITTTDTEYNVLKDKQVVVANTMTKTEVEAVGTGANAPKLTFTAYAVQSANLIDQNNDSKVDAADAWALAPQA